MQEMQEMWVWSLGQEDPLEKEMATHSSILPWEIPWTEEPSRLQFKGSKILGHNEWLSTYGQEFAGVESWGAPGLVAG